MGFHGYYVELARTEAEAAERATLARLQAKYVSPASASPLLPSSPLQSPLSIHLQPPPVAASDEISCLADISDEDEQAETPQYSLFA
jgi:hypothetical protein